MGAFRVGRGMAEAQAGQCDDLVAQCADPVLGLPPPLPFDACAGVQCVVPGKAGQVLTIGRVAVSGLLGVAEDSAPCRTARTELGLGSESEIDFKPARKEEHSVDCRA